MRVDHSAREVLVVTCYLRQSWYDQRLSYQQFINLNMSRLDLNWIFLKTIWKPDTYLLSGRESFLHTITAPNRPGLSTSISRTVFYGISKDYVDRTCRGIKCKTTIFVCCCLLCCLGTPELLIKLDSGPPMGELCEKSDFSP